MISNTKHKQTNTFTFHCVETVHLLGLLLPQLAPGGHWLVLDTRLVLETRLVLDTRLVLETWPALVEVYAPRVRLVLIVVAIHAAL